MNHSVSVSHVQTAPQAGAKSSVPPSVVVDPGPWLTLIMPVSLALTLIVVSWLSKISF